MPNQKRRPIHNKNVHKRSQDVTITDMPEAGLVWVHFADGTMIAGESMEWAKGFQAGWREALFIDPPKEG